MGCDTIHAVMGSARKKLYSALLLSLLSAIVCRAESASANGEESTLKVTNDWILFCIMYESNALDDRISDAATIADAMLTACSDFINFFRVANEMSLTNDDIRKLWQSKAVEFALRTRAKPLAPKELEVLRKKLEEWRKTMKSILEEDDARSPGRLDYYE
jgi:hypothetical protein